MTPDKLKNAKFNFKPAESDDECEECGETQNVFWCDSDFGPLSIALCLDCIDYDYDPDGEN